MISSLLFGLASCANWAVIFTGSSDFTNYRHSADSFYQYYALIERNFPRDHIILLNYDNIARAYENPFTNSIFRELDHQLNVYPGLQYVDYRDKNVTANAFFGVLTGNRTLSGGQRVLESTSEDNVFVFYDNHGGAGFLGVPERNGRYIYADELHEILLKMKNDHMFKNLFFPITACFSFSVGEVIGDILGIYGHTASGAEESSYAILYDEEVGAYLTSEYSYYKDHYIEDNANNGTIGQIYKYALQMMAMSTPHEFGDISMRTMLISEFIGELPNNKVSRHLQMPRNYESVKETEAAQQAQDKHLAQVPRNKKEKRQQMMWAIQDEMKKKADQKLGIILDGLKQQFPIPNSVDVTKWVPEKVRWKHYKAVVEYVRDVLVSPSESFFEQTFYLSHLTSLYDSKEIIQVINSMNIN